jgi:hypothetical protein
MAFMMEISDTGRENVVSRGYLHSSTFNFRNAVAMSMPSSRFNMDEEYYRKTENKMLAIKQRLEAKENEFYLMFGINTGDNARNAFEFNKLFSKSLRRYKVLKKMNTDGFLKMSDGNLTNTIQKVVTKFENTCKDRSIDIGRILNPTDLNSFMEESLKALNVIYPLSLGKRTDKRALKKAFTKSGRINKTMEVRFGEIFKKEFPDEVNKISDQSAKEFLNNMLLYLQPDEELAAVIKKSFNKVKSKLNLQVVERNNRIGIYGEIQTQVFIDLLLDAMADEAPKSFYVGNLYDSTTKKQSPVDFLIGKYGIQVKNTTEAIENSSVKPFYDVKVQSDITLKNFISRLRGADAEEFRYLVSNVIWLRNNGLDGHERSDKLKFDEIPMILGYINNILSTYSEQLLHTEASKIIDKNGRTKGTSYGNTFFLLKGEYLIPISVMIDGIIKAMRLENQKDSVGVGYFYRDDLGVTNKKGDSVQLNAAPNLENAVLIHKTKLEILEAMGMDGSLNLDAYDYSGDLLDYGAGLTDQLTSGVNIRIKYKFITENLNKINNNMKLW